MDPLTLSALIIAGGNLAGQAGNMIGAGTEKLSNYTSGQNKLLQQLLSQLNGLSGEGGGYDNAMGLLNDYLDPESDIYKNFEKPYLQKFEQQTIPQLAEKFAGLGGGMGGALSSSGFGQALGAAGANLQTDLAGMKSKLQRQSINDLLGQYNTLSQQGLNAQPFSYVNYT